MEECVKEINSSLKKHGCTLIAVPTLKPRDDGSWSIVCAIEINKIKEVSPEPTKTLK